MPAVVACGYEDEDGDHAQRFPHMQNALNGVVEALSKQASTTRAQSSGSQISSNGQGGCYIATAVYGSYDAPEVVTLRAFRDQTLAPTKSSRAFIRTYLCGEPIVGQALCAWIGRPSRRAQHTHSPRREAQSEPTEQSSLGTVVLSTQDSCGQHWPRSQACVRRQVGGDWNRTITES